MLRVIKAIPNFDYTIDIYYSNGEIRVYDIKPLLDDELYKPLKQRKLFCSVQPLYDTIAWDDIDIAPETLYEDSVKKNNDLPELKNKKKKNKKESL